MNQKWIVHKFGGTSVADAERYRAAAEIVGPRASDERVAIVVSAMSGVTNGLIQTVELAASRDESYATKLQELQSRHLETIEQLSLTTAQTAALRETIISDFKAIEEVLRGVWITRIPSERITEFVAVEEKCRVGDGNVVGIEEENLTKTRVEKRKHFEFPAAKHLRPMPLGDGDRVDRLCAHFRQETPHRRAHLLVAQIPNLDRQRTVENTTQDANADVSAGEHAGAACAYDDPTTGETLIGTSFYRCDRRVESLPHFAMRRYIFSTGHKANLH